MARTTERFSAKVHVVLIAAMIVSFVLILQQWSITVFRIGVVLLIGTVLVQIPFSNIPPETDLGRSLRLFLKFFSIVALIFALAILLAPYLVKIGGR
jgi:hypothetical protein